MFDKIIKELAMDRCETPLTKTKQNNNVFIDTFLYMAKDANLTQNGGICSVFKSIVPAFWGKKEMFCFFRE